MRYIGLLLCIIICCSMVPALAETTKPLERGTIIYADPENTETAVIVPGPQGPQGQRGYTGPRGPQGLVGPKGDSGEFDPATLLHNGWFWFGVLILLVFFADLYLFRRRDAREFRAALLASADTVTRLTTLVGQISDRENGRYIETRETIGRQDERLRAIERVVHPTLVQLTSSQQQVVLVQAPPTPASTAPAASTP